MPKTLEFFFDYLSPYSYLASTQVEAICARTGAILVWRPVLLGAVFKATSNVGPATNPFKAQYLFKDLLRWTARYGLPELVLPEGFPSNSMKADRLGLVAQEQGRIERYTRAVYAAAFQRGQDIAQAPVLEAVLREAEIDPAPALARAESAEIKARLRVNTDDAVARGAFGVPTFFIGDEIYVGNDRLDFVEAALAR